MSCIIRMHADTGKRDEKRRECGSNGPCFTKNIPAGSTKTHQLGRAGLGQAPGRMGLLPWATPERRSVEESGNPLYPVLRKILLTHLYATALRQGLKKLGLAPKG